jgi:phospholipase/carboxylesterase
VVHTRPNFTTTIVKAHDACADLVFLHGYDMEPGVFSAFARSMKVPVTAHLPQAANRVSEGGFSWWLVDANRRQEELRAGARDFACRLPDRQLAREQLKTYCASIRTSAAVRRPLLLGGFSQGAMLGCDAVLQGDVRADALILLSSCRVALDEWQRSSTSIENLPVLITHGRDDTNIAFAAGQALADYLIGRGARVEWVEFEGGHETPLIVWRAVRRFILKTLEVC